jgi:predicted enzyme related to lactoylglutathione lyase
MARFCRYELRTTDVRSAAAFYAGLFGHPPQEIVKLPAEAAARGAPAHWLGYLGVADLGQAVSAWVAEGATRLGPTRPGPAGGEVAILRDPGGAVAALAAPEGAPATEVAWHVLNTSNAEGTFARHRALFGWQAAGTVEVEGTGRCLTFTWSPGGAAAGVIADLSGRPGVHPHWLFAFRVQRLERAVEAVLAGGGCALETLAPVGGPRLAVCEDREGAAFALAEAGPSGPGAV